MADEPLSDSVVRPGPSRIDPDVCPGGVVIDVYAVPSNVRVIRQHLWPGADVDAAATMAAELDMPGWGACLVAYDGDTGERFPPGAWVAAMLGR
ncbi:MAG TPA: hypothetical protein VK467_09565 [Gemmatimonadales bacterium]|nr:hypothetical protein [Gemmatimonadales bacterium]